MNAYRYNRNDIDISEINRMLAEQIDTLVPEILPNAVRDGVEWRIGSCSGEAGRSMAIHRGGSRAGIWSDFSDSKAHGDAFELVAQVLFSGDRKKTVAWAKSRLGLDNMNPDRIEQVRKEARKKSQDAEKKQAEETERRRKAALAIFLNADENILDTPVDRYLLRRGINLRSLQKLPGSIRYAAELEYYHQDTKTKTKHPAMVALIVNGKGESIAVHRTYLRDDGKEAFKANVPEPKLTLGAWRGGIIPLSRGASGKRLTQAPMDDKVLLCEGIEDALTLACAMPDFRVMATISVGNIQNAPIPENIKEIIIAADNDEPNSPADKSLQSAVNALSRPNRTIRVARVPSGFKDFNDVLNSKTPNGV